MKLVPYLSGWMLALATMGCQPRFMRLRSQLTVRQDATTTAPDATTTPEATVLRGRVRAVGVAAPSECSNQRGVALSGRAEHDVTLLHQRCADEIAELERALIGAGYPVRSWRDIDNYATAHDLSHLEAARTLGADLLIEVNTIGWGPWRRAPANARWDRSIASSDAFGTNRGEVDFESFNDSDVRYFESLYQRAEEEEFGRARGSVYLDLHAVHAGNGALLHSIRWLEAIPFSGQLTVNVLVQQVESGWSPLLPQATASEVRFERSRALSNAAGDDNQTQAARFTLLQRMVREYATALRGVFGAPAATVAAPVVSAAPPPRRGRAPEAREVAVSAEEESAPLGAAPTAEAPTPAATLTPVVIAPQPAAATEVDDPEPRRRRRHRREAP